MVVLKRINEEWRSVPGYGDLEASSLGRLRYRETAAPAKWYVETTGYLRTRMPKRLGEVGGKAEHVHKLVALAFLGPRPEGYFINHMDCDKANPCVDNLEYVTPSENMKHSYDNGVSWSPAGECHPSHRLTGDIVQKIRASDKSSRVLGAQYGVSHTTVLKVKRREKWAHVTDLHEHYEGDNGEE